MAVNWDDFLDLERHDLTNGLWLGPPSGTTPLHASQMPDSATDTSDSHPEEAIQLASLFDGSPLHGYMDEPSSMSNDYFMKDRATFQPFYASQPSLEAIAGIDRHSTYPTPALHSNGPVQSHQVSPNQRQHIQRLASMPVPDPEPTFQPPSAVDYSDDMIFLDRPMEIPSVSTAELERALTATETNNKRTKNSPDIHSACWTSPLCPNHDLTGSPPNPSSCGSGCAPFLFANEDTLPPLPINQVYAQPQEVTGEDGIVEIQPRPMKRSESSSSRELGRQILSSKDNTPTASEMRQLRKSRIAANKENSQNRTDDSKPSKPSRRLPHNQVERKYRESLNAQLEFLRRAIPSLQQNQSPCDTADMEDISTPSKPSKAVILASATAYIKQMEEDKKMLLAENLLLRTRIKASQGLVKCEDCSLMQYVSKLNLNQAKVK